MVGRKGDGWRQTWLDERETGGDRHGWTKRGQLETWFDERGTGGDIVRQKGDGWRVDRLTEGYTDRQT